MTPQETAKILSMCTAIWSSEEVSPSKRAMFTELFKHDAFEVVQAALKAHMLNSTFFPRPADLKRIIAIASADAITEGEAWADVQRQIGLHGYHGYSDTIFTHQCTRKAVLSVGWRRLCLDEDTSFIRRDFNAALNAAFTNYVADLQNGRVHTSKSLPQIVSAISGTSELIAPITGALSVGSTEQ